MTTPQSPHSSIFSAIELVRRHGLARQVPLVGAMLLAGTLDGIGIATLFPILAIITGGVGKPTRLQIAVEEALAFLHLPPSLPILCLLLAALFWIKALIAMWVSRRLGAAGADIAQDMRRRLLQALVSAKWSYFTLQPVGRFVASATTEANWASFAFRTSLQTIEQMTRTIIFCTLAVFMGWRVALVAITMGVLMGLSLRALTRTARRAGARAPTRRATATAIARATVPPCARRHAVATAISRRTAASASAVRCMATACTTAISAGSCRQRPTARAATSSR